MVGARARPRAGVLQGLCTQPRGFVSARARVRLAGPVCQNCLPLEPASLIFSRPLPYSFLLRFRVRSPRLPPPPSRGSRTRTSRPCVCVCVCACVCAVAKLDRFSSLPIASSAPDIRVPHFLSWARPSLLTAMSRKKRRAASWIRMIRTWARGHGHVGHGHVVTDVSHGHVGLAVTSVTAWEPRRPLQRKRDRASSATAPALPRPARSVRRAGLHQ